MLYYFYIKRNAALKINELIVDYSTEFFLNKISSLLDNFEPLKKSTTTNWNLRLNLG